MPEFAYEVKIPRDRLAVLIGTKGDIKKKIERETSTDILIDSKEGDVKVVGEDALSLYLTRDIIRAIGRGFNPETAFLLLRQDYCLEVISLQDFQKSTQIVRIKGRIIGREGKSRRLIEQYTETYISVYGKTVGILGQNENGFHGKKSH